MKASRSAGSGSARRREPRRRSTYVRASAVAICVCLLAGGGALIGWGASRSQPARAAAVVTPTTSALGMWPPSRMTDPQRPQAAAPRPQPSGYTMSLQMKGTFPGYYRPDGPVKVQVAKTWQTEPSTLPIIGTAPGGWLHVRLPQRPDQLTAWIHASDGVEVQTPYRIVVNLKTTHLQLYKLNRLVLDVPAGVGAADTPTPLGHYFVAFLEPPIGPEYGAFIMITSAHSQVIQSWEGTGDAIVAIHGPIGADAEIGTTGAYISNGCVRLHDNDLLHLQDVPPGTPIDIVD